MDAKSAAKKSTAKRKTSSKRQLNLSSGRNSAPPTRHVGGTGGRARRASGSSRPKRPSSAARTTSPAVVGGGLLGGEQGVHYRSQSLPDLGVVWEGVAGYDGLGAALGIDEVALLHQLHTEGSLEPGAPSAYTPPLAHGGGIDGGDSFPPYDSTEWYDSHAPAAMTDATPLALLPEELSGDEGAGLLGSEAIGDFPFTFTDDACDYVDLFPAMVDTV